MRIILALILCCVFSGHAFAGRVDDLIASDVMESLDQLQQKKDELMEKKTALNELSEQLKETKKGQVTYLKIRNVSGTLVIIAIAVGAYAARFPHGIRLTGLKLTLSSYIAALAYGDSMVKLSQSDIEKLSREIILDKVKINQIERNINQQIKHYCKQDGRHELCYKI